MACFGGEALPAATAPEISSGVAADIPTLADLRKQLLSLLLPLLPSRPQFFAKVRRENDSSEIGQQLLTPLSDRWRHEGKSDRIEELCSAAVSDTDDPKAPSTQSRRKVQFQLDVLLLVVLEAHVLLASPSRSGLRPPFPARPIR
jgi:hypothetical protein